MDYRDYSRMLTYFMLDDEPRYWGLHVFAEGMELLGEIRHYENIAAHYSYVRTEEGKRQAERYKKTANGRRRELRRLLKENGAPEKDCEAAVTLRDFEDLIRAYMPTADVVSAEIYRYLFEKSSLFFSPGAFIERLVDNLGDPALWKEGDSVRLRIVKQFLQYAPYQTTSVISAVLKKNGKENIRSAEVKRQTALSLIDETVFEEMDDRDKWDLLRLATDLAGGHFRTQGKTRRHLYLFAFAFGMYVMDPEDLKKARKSGSDLRFRDLERNLLYDFYNASFVQMMSEAYQADPAARAGYDMWPTGAGINYKNWLEVLYIYFLQENHALQEKGAPASERRDLFGRMIRMEEDCKPDWKRKPKVNTGKTARPAKVSFLALDEKNVPVRNVSLTLEAKGQAPLVTLADPGTEPLVLAPGSYRVTPTAWPQDLVPEGTFDLMVVGDGRICVGYDVQEASAGPVPVSFCLAGSAPFSVGFAAEDQAGKWLDRVSFSIRDREGEEVCRAYAVVGQKSPVFQDLEPGTYRIEVGDLPDGETMEGARELVLTKTGRVFVNNRLCADGVVRIQTRPRFTDIYRDYAAELAGISEEDLPLFLRYHFVMSESMTSAGYITVREDQAAASGAFAEWSEEAKKTLVEANRVDEEDKDEDASFNLSLTAMKEAVRAYYEEAMFRMLEELGLAGMEEAIRTYKGERMAARNKRDNKVFGDLGAEEAEAGGDSGKRDFQGNATEAANLERRAAAPRKVLLEKALRLAEEAGRREAAKEVCADIERVFSALDRFDYVTERMAGMMKMDMDGENTFHPGSRGRADLIRVLWICYRFQQDVGGENVRSLYNGLRFYCDPVLEKCRYAPLEFRNLFDAFVVLMLFAWASLKRTIETFLED